MKQSVINCALLRVRHIIMTVSAIIAGLLSIMLGDGTGSEVMRRIAAPPFWNTMYIEIITTSHDSMKETGFGSYKACQDFHMALSSEYPNIKLTTCNGLIDLQNVVRRNPNFVILADKHIIINSGQKIWLSEFFDHTNVNYTGSKKNTLQYDLDKTIAKEIVASKGIATADFFTASPDDYKNSQELPLPFPLFLKPTHAANGNGIDTNSLVHDFNQFQTKVMSLNNKYHCPVLVEAYLDGREFTVAIIEKNNVLTAFVLEVAAPMENGIRILSKTVKTNNTEIVSSVTNKILLSEISTIAKNCFRALGARDFGRIDIKMDCLEQCNFIEANLTPGMNKGSSYFPRACEINAKLTYDNVVNLIIQGALERENGKSGNQKSRSGT